MAPCERMNFSAAASSSCVVTPGRILPASRSIVRDEDLARGRHRVDLGRGLLDDHSRSSRRSVASVARMWSWTSVSRARAVEAPQQAALLVVVDQRLGRLVVDVSSALRTTSRACRRRAGRSGLPSWSQTLVVLGRVELDVVDVAVASRRAGRRCAARTVVVGRVDQQHRGQPAAAALERVVERVGLGDRAREAVEQEAVVALLLDLARGSSRSRARRAPARRCPCTPSPSCPSSVLVGPVLAQHVAGGDVGQAEVLAQARGLRALAGAGRAEEDEVQLDTRNVGR